MQLFKSMMQFDSFFQNAFLELDEDILQNLPDPDIRKIGQHAMDGATAGIGFIKSSINNTGTLSVIVAVTKNYTVWANCGDARGFLCRDGKVSQNLSRKLISVL